MTFLFSMPEMLWNHVEPERAKLLQQNTPYYKIRRRLFENLLTGVNLQSTTDIDRVAEGVLKIKAHEAKKITRPQFIAKYLNGQDYVDWSGNLV